MVRISKGLTDLLRRIHTANEQRKKDPHHPATRTKGEKARNRRRRGER